ncbi:3-phosphoglycerate dehydrogenase family protein [Enterococcus dongliensis]|uniref:D-3-phosphoglycerate dehydrogenase n=1 Tax=Enterococcus dongliensis TaxID=2559925 RepID=A0AAP5KRH1_9ENTE|nr:3-phosphoglycerate dehydrogenase family protein [Enterococcus dongliensis]MDT2597311.1 3-phosphoglycerate dehydrogenase family protein [Enterococcus dongliensis]MDT2604410.1 3-phosphoglycerate dehydrogenase family protein [Enterococcus dongliensis]MDT2635180.1 3-phosphoglycerate dehydrogenase family protein [Enterococcus dongliensis]MDT2637816.1 3-phosphoglycerate dehydrogenase family protein [Enterococcus dongliensis]MDT2638512.1 3-phosphoglycerate dehydrogenase family protein [Enterococcu
MFQIKTFNAIAPEGMARFDQENYRINESEEPDGIILRSQKLHDYDFPKSVLGIARAGAGTNNIPVKKCTEKGIVVFNTPGANANAVKELVIASLLLSVRPMVQGISWVQTLTGTNVDEQAEAQKAQFAGTELEGKKLGVIGLGSIGAMVANDAYRLGMEVTGYDPYVSVDTAWSISRRVKRAKDLKEVLTNCDFVTIHVPLTDQTRHLISTEELLLMKKTARLMNFARGEIVDTAAVVKAVNEDRIAGFTTDFAEEKLLHNDKITVLPHLGASTEEAEVNCAKMAARGLKRFLETGVIKRSVNFPNVEMAFESPYRITIINHNIPNMLGLIASEIATLKVNIDNMVNRGQDDYAYTLVDIAETDPEKIAAIAEKLAENEGIIRVRVIKRDEESEF